MASEQVRKDRPHSTSAEKIHGGSFAADVHGLTGAIPVTGANNTSTQRRAQGQPGKEREGKGEQKNGGQERKEENWPSLEESGLHRATAKQSTTEALRAAEERYEKAKERERQALDEAAEKARKAAEFSSQFAARKRAEAERENQAKDKLGDGNAAAAAAGGEVPRDKNAAEEGGGKGVLGAIGETLVEIGQTAQNLVGGRRSK